MRIALLGASGFVGRHLASLAGDRGHEVIRIGRRPGSEGQWLIHDLASGGAVPIPEGTDAVIFLAQSAHYRGFPEHADDLFAVNALGPVLAAHAAWKAGCRFFLHASSGSVYAPSFAPLFESSPVARATPYATSKLMGEDAALCFRERMRVTTGRIFGAWGEDQRAMLPWILLQRVLKGETIELAPGESGKEDGGLRISLIYVRDLAERMLFLAETALSGEDTPDILNLAGPEAVSIRRFAEGLGACLGREPRFTVAERPRTGDLHADTSLLDRTCPLPYFPLEDGIRAFCATVAGNSNRGKS